MCQIYTFKYIQFPKNIYFYFIIGKKTSLPGAFKKVWQIILNQGKIFKFGGWTGSWGQSLVTGYNEPGGWVKGRTRSWPTPKWSPCGCRESRKENLTGLSECAYFVRKNSVKRLLLETDEVDSAFPKHFRGQAHRGGSRVMLGTCSRRNPAPLITASPPQAPSAPSGTL